MKKIILVAIVVAVLASLIATPVLAKGKDGQSGKSNVGHLYLYEKDSNWDIMPDGAWGKMKYNLSGSTFDFVFNGHGLVSGSDYTLIYYPDKTGNPWPRTGIRCLASGTANEYGDINTSAKIWLVLSSDVDCQTNTMSGWNPTEYLFEHNLISYDDTDV